MGLLSALKSLFSNNTDVSEKVSDTIEYNGFSIVPAPIAEGGQFRVAATISKGKDETLQTHTFIRSDVLANRDECINVTIRKAQMTIDQSGDGIFN